MNLSLRNADKNDMELLFRFANDDEVRKASFTTDQIDIETHKKWFDKKLKSDACDIFIAEDENKIPVGQVRFEYEDGGAVISYSIDKDERGKGYAKVMLKCAMNKVAANRSDITKFVAEVKKDNIASNEVFEKLGFTMISDNPHFVYIMSIDDMKSLQIR